MIEAIILGLVEGLTEFIPVSSTGHLILVQNWLNFTGEKENAFLIFIQLGAILAVLWLYRVKLFRVAVTWPHDEPARRLIINLILGTLPAVLIGLPTEEWIEANLFRPFPVALALLVGGIAILLIETMRKRVTVATVDDISIKKALGVGLIQVLAILFPGVSRSGATIMGGLVLGLSRTAATEFSFFLAIPAMIGASIIKLAGVSDLITTADLPIFAVGFLVAFLSALVVIRGLLRFVTQRSFVPFAWYRILFGLILIAMYWNSNVGF
ncbi:MAG: undecaprenyl-diphosphate phosphatase [Caldilineaceae bacterium]|nr:undecaprenyl-diphosphate phosphatase [Caldilineaceae bacterium]